MAAGPHAALLIHLLDLELMVTVKKSEMLPGKDQYCEDT